jgi:hypothetical protein
MPRSEASSKNSLPVEVNHSLNKTNSSYSLVFLFENNSHTFALSILIDTINH